MIERKKAFRICPCSPYNVEAVQTWLEDLARDGLILEKDGYFAGVFTFLREQPRTMIYRLEPVQKPNASIFDENDPDIDMVESIAEMGWEYMFRYGMFHIYRTTDPHPRELHTDPAVQSMALSAVHKRLAVNIIDSLVWILLWLLTRNTPFGHPFRSAVTIGLTFVLSYSAWFFLFIFQPISGAVMLWRYRKRLKAGDALTSRKDWKRLAPASICAKLLVLLLPCLLVGNVISTLTDATHEPLDRQTEVPFVTIADLMPQGEYSQSSHTFGDYNLYREWSTAVSAVNIEWSEWAKVTSSDGTTYDGILRLDYHETSSEWLARQLAKDYYHYDRHRYNRFSEQEAPETSADSIRIYSNHVNYVLIQHDNIVIHATLTLTDQDNNSLQPLWIEETIRWLTDIP